MSTTGTGGRNVLIARRRAALRRRWRECGALIFQGMGTFPMTTTVEGRLFTQISGDARSSRRGSKTSPGSATRRRGLFSLILPNECAVSWSSRGAHRVRTLQLWRTAGVKRIGGPILRRGAGFIISLTRRARWSDRARGRWPKWVGR